MTRPTNPRSKAGTELTPKLLTELAREAEEGYEPSELKPVRVGRPSLGSSGPSPRVSFRASPELYEAARERAEREGRPVSALARDAFRRYLAES